MKNRQELKDAIISRLDREAEEHPKGHQKSKVNRYAFPSTGDAQIELMFQKDKQSPANLRVKKSFVEKLLDSQLAGMPLEHKISPASNLYQKKGKNGKLLYGRHSGLKSMPQLSDADLECFALHDMDTLVRILDTWKQEK